MVVNIDCSFIVPIILSYKNGLSFIFSNIVVSIDLKNSVMSKSVITIRASNNYNKIVPIYIIIKKS
jgi:hypothetical protein